MLHFRFSLLCLGNNFLFQEEIKAGIAEFGEYNNKKSGKCDAWDSTAQQDHTEARPKNSTQQHKCTKYVLGLRS